MFAALGGPFSGERPPPAVVLANIEARYGLDQPYIVQIFNYDKTSYFISILARHFNTATAL